MKLHKEGYKSLRNEIAILIVLAYFSYISDNQSIDSLLISSLVDRVKKNSIKEVILATSATIEGQTTAHYIQDSLKKLNVKVSKLAQGLPIGGEIENLDDGTLISAFKNRKDLNENK